MSEWTKEPPTEPGWYWIKDTALEPDAVLVARDVGPEGGLFVKYHVRGMGVMLDQINAEWWPEKIEPPNGE